MVGNARKPKDRDGQLTIGQPATTVKEARKLLGKSYEFLSDDEVTRVVALLDSIARKYVQSSVPSY